MTKPTATREESPLELLLEDSRKEFEQVQRELKEIDIDMSGTIDQNELMMLATKKIKLSGTDKMMEALSTHPNMVKRIKHLASLSN